MADCDNPDCCPPEFCAACEHREELHVRGLYPYCSLCNCVRYEPPTRLADALADIKDALYKLLPAAQEHSQVHAGWLLAAHVLVTAFLDDITSDDDPFAGSWLATLARVEAEAAGRPHPTRSEVDGRADG
jgi:hypothetical protein